MRKLNTYVHVGDRRYGPDDTIPDDVAAQITNPDVWDQREDPPVVDAPPLVPPAPAEDPDRPRGNASREDWAAYATGKVEVTGKMSRDDIKAAVEQWDARQPNNQQGS